MLSRHQGKRERVSTGPVQLSGPGGLWLCDPKAIEAGELTTILEQAGHAANEAAARSAFADYRSRKRAE